MCLRGSSEARDAGQFQKQRQSCENDQGRAHTGVLYHLHLKIALPLCLAALSSHPLFGGDEAETASGFLLQIHHQKCDRVVIQLKGAENAVIIRQCNQAFLFGWANCVEAWRFFRWALQGARKLADRFSGVPLAALALLAACWLVSSLPAHAAQQVLKRHVPPITKQLAPINRLQSGAHLDLAIGLPLRNREQLTNLLQDIYQPSSPNFRRFLTTDEFVSSFGPSQQDYQAVIDFAKSHGLTVKRTHPNRTLLDVSGSVADIEKAFHVHMQIFKHPKENRNFFAPDVEPSLDLETPVLAISGLDNYVKPRPRIHPTGASLQPSVRPLGRGQAEAGAGTATAMERAKAFSDTPALISRRLIRPLRCLMERGSRWGSLNFSLSPSRTSWTTKTKSASLPT